MSDTEVISSDEPDALDAPLPDQEEEETEETSEETQDGDEESSEETPGEDAAEEVKPKKRRNVQKRISELTRARHEAERRAQEAERQLQALEATTAPEAEPKQEDFQSIDDYVLARAEWRAEKAVTRKLEELSSTVQQNQQQAAQTAIDANWEVQVEAGRDQFDDFDDVVLDPGNTYFTTAMHRALSMDENGAAIAYHIASNPKLVREVSGLDDIGAVLRIGQLSAKLAQKPVPKQTNAPKPVKTVGGGRSSPRKTLEKMSQKEFEAEMDKREKR